MIKLSHSAQDKYLLCPREYDLHYNEKLRSTDMGSALLFGTAIDAACEDYILERIPLRARGVFKQTWKEQEINGEKTDLQSTTKIKYLGTDFDAELLSESDNEFLIEGTVFATAKELYQNLQGREDLTEDEKIRWNWLNWMSLYRKGSFLVNKFMDFVDENVEEVYKTQPEIELEDQDGDKVTGKADFIVKLRDHAYPVVLDLKTTTKFYDKNSVKESKQLALYVMYFREFYPGMRKAGYVVLNKAIKKNREKICLVCGHDDSGTNNKTCTNKIDGKRCGGGYTNKIYPEATMQFVFDTVPETMIESVITGLNDTKQKIVSKDFTPNYEACVRYGGKFNCVYYQYCRTGCMDGLVSRKKVDNLSEQIIQSEEGVKNG